ncbi:hypothetical protein TH8_19835 [Thalassospira profundimaris]|nr:hypothetical protein TH8_19835 [Thalassospira profundimaris]
MAVAKQRFALPFLEWHGVISLNLVSGSASVTAYPAFFMLVLATFLAQDMRASGPAGQMLVITIEMTVCADPSSRLFDLGCIGAAV